MTCNLFALFPQCHALMHAETVLLVDDDEGESLESDPLLKQGMRADNE